MKSVHLALAFAAAVCMAVLAPKAHAQAGIGVEQATTFTGTIGSNKGDIGSGPLRCPAGTVLRGGYHRDKAMTNEFAGSARGMTVRVGLYCGGITTDGSTVTVQNRFGNGFPDVRSSAYPFPGTEQDGYCPAGQIVQNMSGYDRAWSNQFPWSSSLRLICRPLALNANSWVQVNTAAAETAVQIGVNETVPEETAPHVLRGPFCPNTANSVTSGLYLQAGGVGWDGINVFCGTFLQARHSAVMTFTDFAWSRALGGAGWLVNLTRGTLGTGLDNGAGMSGADRTPHASAAANTNVFQNGREIYVLPGSNYRAEVSRAPTGVAANSYVTSGTCLTGIALSNQQDASCTLNVNGLPDIGVSVVTTPLDYSYPGQALNFTVTGTNYGPGAVAGTDGFTLATTLPAGFTATAVPGCTVAGQVVTCAITTAVAAAATPGASGGSVSFTFPVTVNASTAAGTYSATLRLGRSVPDNDADPANDDFNTANDVATGSLVLAQSSRISLRKALPSGRLASDHQFTLNITAGATTVTATTTGSTTTPTEVATLAAAIPGTAYTLSEAITAGSLANYTSTYSCTNTRANGQTPSGSGTSFSVTPVAGDNLTCTFTNVAPSPPPFTCDATLYLSQADRLYTINRTSNPFAYPALGPVGTPFNAMGYNPRDNYLYALRNGGANAASAELYRIGGDGVQILLGAVAGLPTTGAYFSGAFTAANDNALYVMDGANDTRWYRIDVATRVATALTLSRALYVADFDYANGVFYGVETNTGQLVSINPGDGTVTNLGTPGPSGAIGAFWADSGGLYGALNGGGFYRYDPVSGERTLISNSPTTNSNDGARCPLGTPQAFNADLAITKTDNSPTYTRGANVVYTIVASNNGTFGAQNARVQDALPSGITTASWTCVAAGGAVCRSASGTGAIDARVDLPVGGTATFALTMAVPASFTGDLVNTATVTAGAGTVDPLPDNNSATDTDVASTALTLRKALPDGRRDETDQFTLTIAGTGAPTPQTTSGSGTTASGTVTHAAATAGSTYTLSETGAAGAILANYTSTYSCTNTLPNGQAPGGTGTSFNVTPVTGDGLTCTFTNVPRRADVSIQKTATPNPVVSDGLVEFTLVVTNHGPAAADGATVSDPAAAGLDCIAAGLPAPTCSATGGAGCPASLTPTGLQSGVAIPALPNGGAVTIGLTCRVTASGMP